jgi:hypothetical protein
MPKELSDDSAQMLITENQLLNTILALCTFASLKIYKQVTNFYALSILICTIPQPDWDGTLCGAAKQKRERADKAAQIIRLRL